MIDFKQAKYIKLRPVKDTAFDKILSQIFVDDEMVIGSFQGIRDGVVFTNKRIIAINVQGVTGKKKDYSSLPYRKIQAFSVETAGVFDIDCELVLWFSSLGQVTFEFTSNSNITEICRAIGKYAL